MEKVVQTILLFVQYCQDIVNFPHQSIDSMQSNQNPRGFCRKKLTSCENVTLRTGLYASLDCVRVYHTERGLKAYHSCRVVLFRCSVLFHSSATPWTPSGFSVHGISQTRILEWAALSFSRGLLISVTETPPPAPAGILCQ